MKFPIGKFVRPLLLLLILGGIFFLARPIGGVQAGQAQESTPIPATEEAPTPQPGVPVEVGGQVLFYVNQRVGSFSPAERAALVAERITNLATNPFAPPLEISLVHSSEGIDVMAGDEILLTVTENDARAFGISQQAAAELAAEKIMTAVQTLREQNSTRARLIQLGETLLAIAVLVLLIIAANWLYRWSIKRLQRSAEQKKGIFSRRSGVDNQSALEFFSSILNTLRWIIVIAIIIVVTPVSLSLFPATTALATRLIELLLVPFNTLWTWFGQNQENFFIILIISVVTYLFIQVIKKLFKAIGAGKIKISGFEKEWAPFTSKIISFLLIIGAVIVAYPYFPGSDSDAFKGITIFLGALFTLSSTAAVGNIVAGIIQTYTGAFRVGDVIRIGVVTGIVTEKRLLATRVRTFKNEEVSIPNSTVLNTDVTNFTVMAKRKGLVLYSTVTIGYDVPWRTVHELLIAAALATPDILPEPEPFVLQSALNDYNVSYQINCYTKRPERMYRLYTALHQNIQDQFNQAGVEIMSPAYTAIRDGNTVTIPEASRPEDYQAPGFRIEPGD